MNDLVVLNERTMLHAIDEVDEVHGRDRDQLDAGDRGNSNNPEEAAAVIVFAETVPNGRGEEKQ